MKSDINERKNSKNIIYFLFIIAILSVSVLIYFNINRPIASQKYDTYFEVSDKLGFDLNSSALGFGKTFPGTTVHKELNVMNDNDFPIKVEVLASDSISEVIRVDEEPILAPHTSYSFFVYLDVPQNYSYGNYSGIIIVNFWKYRPD